MILRRLYPYHKNKHKKYSRFLSWILLSVILCSLISVDSYALERKTPYVNRYGVYQDSRKDYFEDYDITLLAVGDNLLHMGLVNSGKKADGSYDYHMLYENMLPFLGKTDIKVINQETPLAGNHLGFSGFPAFNSPTEVGDAVVDSGFNVITHATNHSADRGLDGMTNCVNYWATKPQVLMTGIQNDPALSGPAYLEMKGCKFAILNYTYGPNAEHISKKMIGHLNILCALNESTGAIDFTKLNPKVLEDITLAKQNADVVIVFPHWGTEYQSTPSSYQKAWAQMMTDAGADLIIGTHPHVPQPVAYIPSENGNVSMCYYSLGNYVSTQKQELSMLEGMAYVTFHVTEKEIAINPEKSGVLPLVNHYLANPVRFGNVYCLEDYTEQLAAQHGIHSYGPVNLQLSHLQDYSNRIFGDFVLTKQQILGEPEQSE